MGLLLLWIPQATAATAEKARFVVLPFVVQGPQGFAYLERSIPQMLTSRLYWKGRVEPAVADLPASQKAVGDESSAEKARASYKADYVVWGSVTVVGETCSIDVRVRNKAGKVWPYSREAKPTVVISALTSISDAINLDIFGRKPEGSSRQSTDSGRVNQMNPDILINENSPKQVYLNPQFRYEGPSAGDNSRLRSQTLPFSALSMDVVDADGDGRNEILILADGTLYAYRFAGDSMTQIGQIKLPRTSMQLAVRALGSRNSPAQIFITMVDKDGTPTSSVYSFNGKEFKEEVKNQHYYFNVAKLPPDYIPTLIGQMAQPPRLFRPGVYEMIKMNGTYTQGRRLDLPENTNVFNFTYMPAGKGEKDGGKLIVLNDDERLVTYTHKGGRLSESPEKYSGSAVGMEVNPTMPGLGDEGSTLRSMYYMPMRMPAVDLERDGNYELIVNRPISTASGVFDRYRFFPQSEIHSLFWDGVGMNLQWKTRRIKGSVVDYAIADANNDGVMDLVTCLNTHPGALGIKDRKAMIVIYPMDLAKVDPRTPSPREDD